MKSLSIIFCIGISTSVVFAAPTAAWTKTPAEITGNVLNTPPSSGEISYVTTFTLGETLPTSTITLNKIDLWACGNANFKLTSDAKLAVTLNRNASNTSTDDTTYTSAFTVAANTTHSFAMVCTGATTSAPVMRYYLDDVLIHTQTYNATLTNSQLNNSESTLTDTGYTITAISGYQVALSTADLLSIISEADVLSSIEVGETVSVAYNALPTPCLVNGTLEATGNGLIVIDSSYSRIYGSGTICYKNTSGWMMLPGTPWASTLTFENQSVDGIVIPPSSTSNTNYSATDPFVCKNLSGVGDFRADWGSDNIERYLRTVQSKDSTYSGICRTTGGNRLIHLAVASSDNGASSLTLTGAHTSLGTLTVESTGNVNLTGSWAGPIENNGSLTLGTAPFTSTTSQLTTADGATLNFTAGKLSVNTFTATGTLTITYPETLPSGTTLLAWDSGALSESVMLNGKAKLNDTRTALLSTIELPIYTPIGNPTITYKGEPITDEINSDALGFLQQQQTPEGEETATSVQIPIVKQNGVELSASDAAEVAYWLNMTPDTANEIAFTFELSAIQSSYDTTFLLEVDLSISKGTPGTLLNAILVIQGQSQINGEWEDLLESEYPAITLENGHCNWQIDNVNFGFNRFARIILRSWDGETSVRSPATILLENDSTRVNEPFVRELQEEVALLSGTVPSDGNVECVVSGTGSKTATFSLYNANGDLIETAKVGSSSESNRILFTPQTAGETVTIKVTPAITGLGAIQVEGSSLGLGSTPALRTVARLGLSPRDDSTSLADADKLMTATTYSGCYRIPAIAAYKGTLVALWDIRYRGNWTGGGDLGASDCGSDIMRGISTDGGKTWEVARAIDVSNAYDQTGSTQTITSEVDVGDPCILADEANDILYCMVMTGGGLHQYGKGNDCVIYTSTDGGKTWGNRTSIKSKIVSDLGLTNIKGILEGPGAGIVTRDGVLVFPMQVFYSSGGTTQPFIVVSEDHGTTWQAKGLPSTSVSLTATSESAVIELDNGDIVLMSKSESAYGQHDFFRTADLGATWTKLAAIVDVGGCRCQGSLLRVRESQGTVGAIYAAAWPTLKEDVTGVIKDPDNAPTTTATGNNYRGKIEIRFGVDTGSASGSTEEPIDWSNNAADRLLIRESVNGMAYSSMVMVDSDTLGIFYENDGYRNDNKNGADKSGRGMFFETIDLRPIYHRYDTP